MRHFGIIGKPIEHSFSASYFTEKFKRESIDAEYSLYLCETLNEALVQIEKLDGCNVTIPYKQAIIPYLRALDKRAEEIGAVNVVKEGVGYNTDCIGFTESLKPLLLPYDKQALVLGNGGVAQAVCYALRQLGIIPTIVSRHPDKRILGYDQLTSAVMEEHTLIVNCTPLGMWPDTENKPAIPYDHITARHLLYDCIYNPEETQFLKEGQKRGARTINGMQMLHLQAEAAWKIWNNN